MKISHPNFQNTGHMLKTDNIIHNQLVTLSKTDRKLQNKKYDDKFLETYLQHLFYTSNDSFMTACLKWMQSWLQSCLTAHQRPPPICSDTVGQPRQRSMLLRFLIDCKDKTTYASLGLENHSLQDYNNTWIWCKNPRVDALVFNGKGVVTRSYPLPRNY